MAKRIRTTLGGDRLGSGNRQKIEMHNYYRSNHNLSCSRVSSMAPGVLYPMYVNIGLTGDTWDIDLNAFMRTLPTEGPLFGAFKLQVDVFSADMRLYQAILHNNTTEIGFDMDQVLLPKIEVTGTAIPKSKFGQFSNTSLMKYLGMSGIGRTYRSQPTTISRKINAVPLLAYYDIFKNYYSNKQEENAYVIAEEQTIQRFDPTINNVNTYNVNEGTQTPINNTTTYVSEDFVGVEPINSALTISASGTGTNAIYSFSGDNLTDAPEKIYVKYLNTGKIEALEQTEILEKYPDYVTFITNNKITIDLGVAIGFPVETRITNTGNVNLQPFPLKNIDLMRKRLLTSWDLGEEIIIGKHQEILPYSAVTGVRSVKDKDNVVRTVSKNTSPMQGLVVKCYQSDWFNNWLDSEYIAKIAEKSNVNVSNGSFSIDALNFAKKLYEHYNRIAVTGGTYDDWQKAAYGMVRYGKAEKPIYHGGMSSEVIFDEVISTSQTTNADGEVNPLGSLGGRGALKSRKGGHVIIKCNEQCVIMIMVSLTPRTTQTQGNAWYLTELDSMNDLHQPDFDRIGFQDLIVEQMAWWSAIIAEDGNILQTSAGKQPAWIQYQTDIDKAFGDMAEEDGYGYMILQRQYELDEDTGGVKDVTTYIDPSKYNYAFAVSSLTAQNFWGFFNFDIKVRRLMSAKQMPNV